MYQPPRDPYYPEKLRYPVWPLPEMVLAGARFRHGRLQAGLSQRRLAELAGVSQSLISQFERGLTLGLGAIRLVRIAEALGPQFPFGSCPHEHRCAWPRDPVAEAARRPIL